MIPPDPEAHALCTDVIPSDPEASKLCNQLRWLGTVVTSHTASIRQAYTPVMSMLQKAVQRSHCNSCNQPAHTNAIMLYAVKCSLYEVDPFYAGYCIKVGLQG